LVVDLSVGGLQILAANAKALAQTSYRLELVSGGRRGSGRQYDVHLVWSHPDGVNDSPGFAAEKLPFTDGGLLEVKLAIGQ
jgi:hypothetical protein